MNDDNGNLHSGRLYFIDTEDGMLAGQGNDAIRIRMCTSINAFFHTCLNVAMRKCAKNLVNSQRCKRVQYYYYFYNIINKYIELPSVWKEEEIVLHLEHGRNVL